jgi:glucosylceramidase
LAWDHNWDEPQYPIAVLNDPGANRFISGSAFHCYAGGVGAQSQVHQAHPTKDIYLTECSGGGWMTDFGTNMRWTASNLIIGGMRHWARTVLLWNLALDTQSGPQNGGCTNCRGVVTVRSMSSVAYNVEYYVLGHASKFVAPGARRIGSTSFNPGGVESVAFRNPDGSKALIVLNGAWSGSAEVKVRWAGQSFKYTLPAGTLVTFTWGAA